MNSEVHRVPGESQNCQKTHIEFNQKEIKGVIKYKLTSLRNKVSANLKQIYLNLLLLLQLIT
jgi:hypothetical protein